MIKRVMLVAVLLAMPLASAFGADTAKDSHFDAAMQLLKAMNSENVINSAMGQMLEMQMKQQPFLRPYKGIMESFLKKCMSWDALKDDLAKIYQAEFTEQELKELTAFYQSPTGKKYAEKLPTLTQKQAMLGAQRVQQNIGELQKMIIEEQAKQAAPEEEEDAPAAPEAAPTP